MVADTCLKLAYYKGLYALSHADGKWQFRFKYLDK